MKKLTQSKLTLPRIYGSNPCRLVASNRREVHSPTLPLLVNPWFITGFVDAEGCFSIGVLKSSKSKSGWRIQPCFQMALHKKDLALLERIQLFFGVGAIYNHGSDSVQLRVGSLGDLKVLISHFEKYPLLSQKSGDFQLFKRVVEMMISKEHLTPRGLQEIVNIRASINNGLSDSLKVAFPNTIPVIRPLVIDPKIPDPNWVSGFAAGEGSFSINVLKFNNKAGVQIQLKFKLTQHTRDEELVKSLINYLDCGNYYPFAGRELGNFYVAGLSDILNKIIPFFDKYPIMGVKALDYADFRWAAELMKNKDHLTPTGLDEILKIKEGMNRGRS